MCAQTFLLSWASLSALRPLRMLGCTCPLFTCAKARNAQHKASEARFVKDWVGGAPSRKYGRESDGDDLCQVPLGFRQRPLIVTRLGHGPGFLQERSHLGPVVRLLDCQDR